MNRDVIETAIAEARRFIDRAEEAHGAQEWHEFTNAPGGYWRNLNTKATGAMKRASMDLTRALADLRRPS